MNDATNWVFPSKQYGTRLETKTDKWNPIYLQAAKEIAVEVSNECGRKIGFATLNSNLATQRSAYFTEVRRRLNQRVIQLTKENNRHANSKDKSSRSSHTV
ncbi:hypothetical protein E3O62_02615 [Cryobacterium sp. TMT2-15-1]|uniref:hypothetical protein n=1 Tax=Cryobacterium sp. TMT2-15-1 TaxID=1259246 RepID=UPI00106C3D1F|nr:hypothetical protein [Cryobacterium sp. TMT2-15-1]TFC63738.1 hypothetical protein E3O62_02615 [Cryobacterium sp. TMT2-15-1]